MSNLFFLFLKIYHHNNSLHQHFNFPPLVGVKSEVTFKHDDNILWILNFDESEHKLGTKVKGGIQGQRYHNPSFPQAGDCNIKSNKYITGVYRNNPLEPLSALFIFDTKAKSESNYCIDPAWCKNLPKVRAIYGIGSERECGIHLFQFAQRDELIKHFFIILESSNSPLLSQFEARNSM